MPRREMLIFSALMIPEVVAGFEGYMVLAGLTQWIRMFGDPIMVGWIVSAYLIVSAAAAAVVGRLGDIYGRRKILLLVMAICALGSLISGLTNNLVLIIAGRSIQGVAGAIIPLCFGLAREHLPADRVPSATGFIIATATVSGTLGLILGGVLTDNYGPQCIFWASFAVTVAAFFYTKFALPEPTEQRAPGRIDIIGAVLFAPAITLVLVALSNMGRWGLFAPATIGLIAAGLGLMVMWARHELRHPDPMIDVRLLMRRESLSAYLATAMLGLGAWQIVQLTTLLLQQSPSTGVGFGFSATLAGTMKLPSLLFGTVASIWGGWVSGRRGGRLPMVVGFAMASTMFFISAVDHSSSITVVTVMILGAAGISMLVAGTSNLLIEVSPEHRLSEVIGLMSVVRAIFQAIGAQLLVVVLASSVVRTGVSGAAFPDSSAYSRAYLFLALTSALGLAAAVPRWKRKAVGKGP